jgi:hypothetical protein
MQRLEQAKASSNGLLFLRGLGAHSAGNDDEAMTFLRTAVEHDPKSVRAQAHLVLLQRTPDRAYAELKKLYTMNPHHQLVVHAGPMILATYEEYSRRVKDPGAARAPITL